MRHPQLQSFTKRCVPPSPGVPGGPGRASQWVRRVAWLGPLQFILLGVVRASVAQAHEDQLAAQRQWVAVDVFHVSRTLPSLSRMVDLPIDPGVQGRYHRDWLHGDQLSLGGSAQLGIWQFDQLYWAPSLGVGLDSAWRPGHGLFAGFGMRLDYARLFMDVGDVKLERFHFDGGVVSNVYDVADFLDAAMDRQRFPERRR